MLIQNTGDVLEIELDEEDFEPTYIEMVEKSISTLYQRSEDTIAIENIDDKGSYYRNYIIGNNRFAGTQKKATTHGINNMADGINKNYIQMMLITNQDFIDCLSDFQFVKTQQGSYGHHDTWDFDFFTQPAIIKYNAIEVPVRLELIGAYADYRVSDNYEDLLYNFRIRDLTTDFTKDRNQYDNVKVWSNKQTKAQAGFKQLLSLMPANSLDELKIEDIVKATGKDISQEIQDWYNTCAIHKTIENGHGRYRDTWSAIEELEYVADNIIERLWDGIKYGKGFITVNSFTNPGTFNETVKQYEARLEARLESCHYR